MEILVLPFLALLVWILFFFIFISKKASEDNIRGTTSRFWAKLLLLSFGCGFLGALIFDLIAAMGFLPDFIENSVLAHAGSFGGFIFGTIYVLVNSESTKN